MLGVVIFLALILQFLTLGLDCATSGELEPTQLCYCLRALAEALECLAKKKISISQNLYDCLATKKIYGQFGEHPLDVVRVNTWKIYKMAHDEKFKNADNEEKYFKTEVKSIIESGISTRFDLVRLSTFIDQRVFCHVSEVMPIRLIIPRILQVGATQSLSPLVGGIFAKLFS